MKKTPIYTLILLLFLHCSNEKNTTQKPETPPELKVVTVTELSKKVNETSGLIYFNQLFWTINDSGGKPVLYGIDEKTGEITKEVNVTNAKNIDWEDIAQDKNFIYIADTGNNTGKRKEFQIYKISKKDILNQSDKDIDVMATTITFKFQNLPENLETHNHNFDMESLAIVKDRLFIFSKNWGDRKSTCYDVTDGIAKEINSYDPNGLLTGIDYDAVNNRIIAIGYHKYEMVHHKPPFLLIITDFNTKKEHYNKYELSDVKGLQVEGICLKNRDIYISNEKNGNGEQSLKKILFISKK